MNIGKTVSHYRILEKLGQGGLGEVFLAEDTILNRHVALKFLTMDGPQARKQILDEARAAASIDHPYACKVFEAGDWEGKSFIAMEFLQGDTLSERLRAGRIPLSEVLKIATEISEALADAHEKRLVHCDLKPANVMIVKNGHVKLMDFGLARSAPRNTTDDPTEVLTMAQREVAGTPAYMPPEQIRGQNLDPRTDVFAFGIVLFEMLAGVNPFRKNSARECMDAILHEDPPRIEQLVPDVPSTLSGILRRALSKRPSDRFPSARELWAELIGIPPAGPAHLNPTVPAAPPVAVEPTAIAILPFTDFSPKRDQEYFCQGLAEELMTALGHVAELRVASRTAAFRFKAEDLDLSEIRRVLKVSALLEGSVQKSGDRVRISLKLVDLESGFPVWSERYDKTLDDIFAVQDEISRAVVAKLRNTFTSPGNPVEGRPQNVRAYEHYLKGRFFWNKRTEEGLRQSVEQFERALAEEPEYALAYSGLSDAYLTLGLQGASPPMEVMVQAKTAADWALRLNPRLVEAIVSRACLHAIFDWDWASADAGFAEAIAIDPMHARARQWRAMHCLLPLGQFEEARQELVRAGELEPVSQIVAASLGVLYFFEGKNEQAADALRSVLDLDRTYYLAHFFLGQVLVEQHAFDEGIAELQIAADLAGRSFESIAALACAQARAGREDEAGSALRDLEQSRQYVSPVLLAQIQIGLGNEEAALTHLMNAVQLRSTDLIWLKVRPLFQSMRSHPKIQEILRQLGLEKGTNEQPEERTEPSV